jgi:ribosome maturation factor RimP
MTSVAELEELLRPEVERLGYGLVRVMMMGGSRTATLQVMAERPETRQLTLDDCARISRALSDLLDEADPIAGEYRLEVSSPGIDRPLTRPQDFEEWAGHEARLNLAEPLDGRKRIHGVLKGLAEATAGSDGGPVVLVQPEGAAEPLAVPFERIKNAKLVLTDKLIRATAPIDATGADRIIEEK